MITPNSIIFKKVESLECHVCDGSGIIKEYDISWTCPNCNNKGEDNMTVKELIKTLQKEDQNKEVYFEYMECDYYGEYFRSNKEFNKDMIKHDVMYGRDIIILGKV